MALARVQASSKYTQNSAASIALSSIPLPTVGNSLIVFVNMWRPSPFTQLPTTCTDNRGNTYALAKQQDYAGSNPVTSIYYCSIVTAASAPFTITVNGSAAGLYWQAMSVEHSGIGTGISVDQTASASGTIAGTPQLPNTGATPAVTYTDVIEAASHAIGGSQGAITVGVQSPVWTQELEELTNSQIAGECNTRIVPSATGTTPNCSWTDTSTGQKWVAAIVVFKPGIAPTVTEKIQAIIIGV